MIGMGSGQDSVSGRVLPAGKAGVAGDGMPDVLRTFVGNRVWFGANFGQEPAGVEAGVLDAIFGLPAAGTPGIGCASEGAVEQQVVAWFYGFVGSVQMGVCSEYVGSGTPVRELYVGSKRT